MKRIGFLLLAVATLAGIVAYMAHASGQSDGDSSPIYGVKIPCFAARDMDGVLADYSAGRGGSLLLKWCDLLMLSAEWGEASY